MLSVADHDGRHTAAWYCYAWRCAVSLLPTLLGVTGALYFFGALTPPRYTGVSVARPPPRARLARLPVSIVYLPAPAHAHGGDKVV